jgi:hypothetical protein
MLKQMEALVDIQRPFYRKYPPESRI